MSFFVPIILFSNSQNCQGSSFNSKESNSKDEESNSKDEESASKNEESNILTKEKKELNYWLNKYNIKPVIEFESLHKDETIEKIKLETRKKAGIYGIFNLITGDFYIGSAITNKFYSRFYRHLIKGLGSKYVYHSVNKYKLENFAFVILEYFPEEVTRKNNKILMDLDTKWLKTYSPPYNILLEAGNSFGYKHTEEIKQKMKENYSDERKFQAASINKGKSLSESTKILMREKAFNRSDEYKDKVRKTLSKSVILYNLDLSIYKTFPGLYVMAKHFKCDTRTINKAIKNKSLFKKQWHVKFEDNLKT